MDRNDHRSRLIPTMSPMSRDLTIPAHLLCPISLELMQDPVTTPSGITYDRRSIEGWMGMGMGNTLCPVTNQPIYADQLVPNHAVRVTIQDWCEYLGVARIPTPRVPVTQHDAVEILSGIGAAAEMGDRVACRRMVEKMNGVVRESERNKECMRASGAGVVLSKCFRSFSQVDQEAANMEALEEILSVLVTMLPMDTEVRSIMGASNSLRSLAWILNHGNLEGRVDAVRTARELVHPPEAIVLVEPLVKLLKEPISSQTTKASLHSVFHLVSTSTSTAATTRLVELGIIDVVVEILFDCDKSFSETCLGVLDGICEEEAGRVAALGHELTMTVLVKKLLRVSDAATGLAASVLWKLLCKSNGSGSGRWRWGIKEALQVGAFQKLLLVLQVGCGVETKAKVSELLRTLNSYRGSLECVESVDFKWLKRPF